MEYSIIPKHDSEKLHLMQWFNSLGFVLLLAYGEWYHWLICLFVYFLTGCLGMSMTFHRFHAHKSWDAPWWFELWGTLFGVYGATGSPIGWVAVHREHHQHSDTEKDPHSPLHKGFFWTQFLSMYAKPNIRYVKDLIRNPFLKLIHKHYFHIHLGIIIFWLIVNPMMLLAAYLAPNFILWHAGSSINSINHMFGTKDCDMDDNSKNNIVTASLVWGEGWHNRHHSDPSKFMLDFFDISGLLILLIGNFRKEN